MLDRVRWFPGARELIVQARAEMPQKDELCGAFVAVVSLRAYGIEISDQDEAAAAAGIRLLAGGTPEGRPPGEKIRDDYRISLPRTQNAAEAGASSAGVAHAIEVLSAGRLRAVPACGDWTSARLGELLTALYDLRWVAPVANVDTAELGAFDTPATALADYLDGGLPPFWSSRWHTGHFTLLTGVATGEGGALVSVMDSYPSLGDRGLHLQLLDRLALALRRERLGRPGGVLLTVPEADAERAAGLITRAGLRVGLW